MENYLMILAVIVSPFIAVFVQKEVEKFRERRERKLWIFKTLMATRGDTLSKEHVQALNMIDLEYSGKNSKEGKVRDIWEELLHHLGTLSHDSELSKKQLPHWTDKRKDFLANLLVAMGDCFGYNFKRTYIKQGIYTPQGLDFREWTKEEIDKGLLDVLWGNTPIRTIIELKENNLGAIEPGTVDNKTIDSEAGKSSKK